MRNSLEITDERNLLEQRGVEIIETCRTEIRMLNEDEQKELQGIKDRIAKLNEEMDELERSLKTDMTGKEEKTNIEIKSTEKMEKEFRLLKAINDIANNRNLDEVSSAVVNEGNKEFRKAGLSYSGQIQLPTEMRAAITYASEGTDVIATNLYNILEPLRAKNVLVQAGAKFLTGLTGDVQVPVMDGASVTWESETGAAKDGAGSFDSVKLSPKRLTAYIDISKQFLAQDSLAAEALIRQDLINAINSKLEATILGSANGSATQPAGLFYTAGTLPVITDFSGLCNLESDIEDANIIGECKYVMSNKAKAKFRNMAKSAKSTQLVMEGGQIDGTPVLNTSNVGGTNLAYGDFSQLAIGQWGSIDLLVDPYTKAAAGQVRLVVNAFFDAKLLRAGAISCATV